MEIVDHALDTLAPGGHDDAHGHHGLSQAQKNYLLRWGWWAYIASEVMLFSSFIAVMALAKRLYPEQQEILQVPLTTLGTFLLLTSSWTLVRALASIQQGDKVGLQRGLFLTLVLGTVFVGIQTYEYLHLSHEGLVLGSSMFADSFYILTGFHGIHVIIGVLWLLRNFIKSLRGDFDQNNYIGIEVFGLYWHFVDIVWVIIYPLVYLLH